MVNMIKALSPNPRRKVVKEPRPTSLDDAVALTLETFRAGDQQASYMPQVPQHAAMQAMAPPPQHQKPQYTELDAVN